MRSPLESLRRWKARLWHLPWDAQLEESLQLEVAFHQLAAEVEEGLRDIDFDEVTTDDRIAFVEAAVAWQVRRTLACGRFDLALRIQRYGAERVARGGRNGQCAPGEDDREHDDAESSTAW